MMKTTRPIFPSPATHFTTARLLIRPITTNDVDEFHNLRTQPEVMIHTSTGKIDSDRTATQEWIEGFTSPNDLTTWNFAIEELERPGTIIGTIGSHIAEPPTLGYMFCKEYWGKGYASEALRGWLQEYWLLPRREVDAAGDEVDMGGDDGTGKERLVAVIEARNAGSRKVVEKCGFSLTGKKETEDDWRGPAVLLTYAIVRPEGNIQS